MSVVDDVYEVMHTWVRTYADPDGGTLATDKAIPADDEGGRPELPYVTLFFEDHGRVAHHDEVIYSLDEADDPQYQVMGDRSGLVQVHAYGAGSNLWLENLTWSLKREDVQLAFYDGGVTVLAPLGGIRSLPRQINANREPHYVLVFPYTYRVSSGMIPATSADTAQVNATLYEVDPEADGFVVDVDVDMT